MSPENQKKIINRVVQAGEATLRERHYVMAIDILKGIGWLTEAQVLDWRRGRVLYLERVVDSNLERISFAMKQFRKWAQNRGLYPSETKYMRKTRTGKRELRFSKSGNPHIEKAYRTHYVSPKSSNQI